MHVGWAPSVVSSVMKVIFVECRGGAIYHSSCSTCNPLVDQCICFICVFSRHGSCFSLYRCFLGFIFYGQYTARSQPPGGGVTVPVVVDVHFGDLNVGRDERPVFGELATGRPAGCISCFVFFGKWEVTNIYNIQS